MQISHDNKIRKRIFYCITVISFFTISFFQSILYADNNTIFLDSSSSGIQLNNKIEIFEDQQGDLTIDDIIANNNSVQFIKNSNGITNLGYSLSAYWIKFSIKLNKPDCRKWFLKFDYPHMDSIIFFKPDGNESYTQQLYGDTLPFNKRDLKSRHFFLNIQPDHEQIKTYYMRIQSEGAINFPLSILSQEYFSIQDHEEQIIFGIFYGILIITLIYNIFLFLSIKNKVYIHYIILCFVILLYQFELSGHAFEYIWPGFPGINEKADMVLIGLGLVWLGIFSKEFLLSRINTPTLHRLLLLVTGLSGLFTILSLIFSKKDLIHFSAFLPITMVIIIVIIALKSFFKGYRQARFFIIAWFTAFLGIIIFPLHRLGILPLNFFTQYIFQIGIITNIILLSFGIVDNINIMRDEKEKAEMRVKENLEDEVEERTRELNTVMLDLRKTNSDLQKLSMLDPLTGIYNRRFFNEEIDTEWKRSIRKDLKFSLLMIDVDYFKNYNDIYGHIAGDTILIQIAAILRRSLHRSSDKITRFGGEEFAVILPETPLDGAKTIGEKMINEILSLEIEHSGSNYKIITISIGAASNDTPGVESSGSLINASDSALYRAKRGGRNCLFV